MNQIGEKVKSILLNKYVLGAGLILASTHCVVKLMRKRKRDQKRKSYPKDVVILHQYPNLGFRAPSVMPFVVKLETWLRMANIKYEVAIIYYSIHYFFCINLCPCCD